MIVHRLKHPVVQRGIHLTALTLRRPTPADRSSIAYAAARDGAESNISRIPYLIAQLADLPVDVVRKLSRSDAQKIAWDAHKLFQDAVLV